MHPTDRDQNTNLYIAEYIWKRIPYFSGIQRSLMPKIAERMKSQRFKASEYIIKEGDEGDRMFVLMRGKAEVFINGRYIAAIYDHK